MMFYSVGYLCPSVEVHMVFVIMPEITVSVYINFIDYCCSIDLFLLLMKYGMLIGSDLSGPLLFGLENIQRIVFHFYQFSNLRV